MIGTAPCAPLAPPFVWFGGETQAAPLIWQALGDVPNYVDPFAGALAVPLQRPHAPGIETVNDKDAFICNAFRAIRADPAGVADAATWLPHECDLHARHAWLLTQRDDLPARLMGDPWYYDVQIAGWWLWGISLWIGGGWCSGAGAWHVVDGKLVKGESGGEGVSRRRLQLSDAGQGVHRTATDLVTYMGALSQRLARMRICCGDWQRILGPSVTWKNSGISGRDMTGILLDPPYAHSERDAGLYRIDDDCSAAVRAWAVANGNNPRLRIVLCGYDDGDAAIPPTWQRVPWTANGGMAHTGAGRGKANRSRELLWCSPHCETVTQQLDFFTPTPGVGREKRECDDTQKC